MAMRPRKREVEQLAELLDTEGIVLEDMAAGALRLSFDLLMERELWVVVTTWPTGYSNALFVHGPYFTRRQAEKSIEGNEIHPRHPEARTVIRRLVTAVADGSDDEPSVLPAA